jgi:hypothetical protein
MSKLANRLRKLLTVDFVEGLKTRRRDALTVWQDAVRLAAAGQEIDIGAVDEAAVALRIGDVPGSFESDVLSYQAAQEAVRTYDRLKLEVASGAAEFARRGKRVHELDAERMQLLADMRQYEGVSVSAAYAERDVRVAQQKSPRMFAKELAEGARLEGQPAPSVEQIHAIAVPPVASTASVSGHSRSTPSNEAEWVIDDNDGL